MSAGLHGIDSHSFLELLSCFAGSALIEQLPAALHIEGNATGGIGLAQRFLVSVFHLQRKLDVPRLVILAFYSLLRKLGRQHSAVGAFSQKTAIPHATLTA